MGVGGQGAEMLPQQVINNSAAVQQEDEVCGLTYTVVS
jgi:hypothetical protein